MRRVVHSSVTPCEFIVRLQQLNPTRVRSGRKSSRPRFSTSSRPTTCSACMALEAQRVLLLDRDVSPAPSHLSGRDVSATFTLADGSVLRTTNWWGQR